MRHFTFLNQEYENLNSLGVEFSRNFYEAAEAIQNKKFLHFIKQFKDQRKELMRILYETRYVNNAASILIYQMTDEHILNIGGKRYYSLQDIWKELSQNPNISLFLSDRGLTNTLCHTLENERLKADIRTLEENCYDPFAIYFFEHYEDYDSIEPMEVILKDLIISSEEKFNNALKLFSKEEVCLHMAHAYSLGEVMQMRKASCPVFAGLKMAQSDFSVEDLKMILEDNFYYSILSHLNYYQFKRKSDHFKKKFLKLKKRWDKKIKKDQSFNTLLDAHKEIYEMYLKMIDYYKKEWIKEKKKYPDAALNIPYAQTYISKTNMDGKTLTLDEEKEYVPSSKVDYQLKKLNKSIRNHQAFARTAMVFLIIYSLILAALILVAKALPDVIKNVGNLATSVDQLLSIEGGLLPLILGISLTLVATIFIMVKKGIARKKYFQLCKLVYYRQNTSILTSKEKVHYQKLEAKEEKNAKVIDRFYRFYGAFDMAFLAIVVVLFGVVMVSSFADTISKDLATNAYSLLSGKFYLMFIPSAVILLLGLLRHKKTFWSVILTLLIALAGSIGICFIAGMM